MLVVLISMIWLSRTCLLTPDNYPESMSCINVMACSPTNDSGSVVIYQNCNGSWYNYSWLASIVSSSSQSSINFYPTESKRLSKIFQNANATNIKLFGNLTLISSNQQLFYFDLLMSHGESIPLNCNFTAFDYIFSNQSYQIIILCSNTISITALDSQIQKRLTPQYYNLSNSDNCISLKCTQNSSICLIGTQNGNLIMYNVNSLTIENQITINSNISLTHIEYIYINQNVSKIYTINSNGTINQYLYNTSVPSNASKVLSKQNLNVRASSTVQNSQITHQRLNNMPLGTTVYQFMISTDSQFLLITDTKGNILSYNISSGLLSNKSFGSWMNNTSNMRVSMVMSIQHSLFWYNTANSIISYLNITAGNFSNSKYPMFHCSFMNYYNQTVKICMLCSQNCSTCDSYTGDCITCINGFFNKDGRCYNCYYSSQSLTNYLDICFTGTEQALMQGSAQVILSMLVVLSNFATFLNLCGILFLFLKLINNWNILSIYFFLPINMPFFLSNILMIMFEAFNSSIFQTIGITADFGIGIEDGSENHKFQLAKLTTDFFATNAQAIIMYIYSVILILTVYKAVNHCLSKYKIQAFQENSIISILQEFVGAFTSSLIPVYYIIAGPNSGYRTFLDKINSFCFYTLLCLVVIVPFYYLNIKKDTSQDTNNKIMNDNKETPDKIQKSSTNHNTSIWAIQQNRQNLLYTLLSFSIPLLACNSSPVMFFIIVSIIHILSIVNLVLSAQRKRIIIFQKILFLLFHLCFVLIYLIENNSIKLMISIFAVFIIIVEGLQEIITSVILRTYFMYIIIKAKIRHNNHMNKQFATIEKKQKDTQNEPQIAQKIQISKTKKKKNVIILYHNVQNNSKKHSLKLSEYKAKTTKNLQILQKKETSIIKDYQISEDYQTFGNYKKQRGKTVAELQEQKQKQKPNFKSLMSFRQIRH